VKVLYIYNLYQHSGGENRWFDAEPELLRTNGHDVVVYCRDNREIDELSAWGKASLLWKASWSERSYREVAEIIERNRPDVAHVYNTLAMVTPSIYYACRAAGVPVVQTLYNYRLLCPRATLLKNGAICEECIEHSLWRAVRHGCYRDSRLQSAAVAAMLQAHRRRGTWSDLIDTYLVPTEFMRQKFIAGGLPANKIVVKPNFHEPDPGTRERSDGYALYVGRLASEKGVRTMMRAWSATGAPLGIIGDGPLAAEVAAWGRSRTEVTFHGALAHDQVIDHLKRAEYLLLPSEWYEGFPHVILEAFACGVPVVASRIGTLQDVVADGRTGVLFRPGDFTSR
jgi:glycosyltransferase involved in cell wall biosynthesis